MTDTSRRLSGLSAFACFVRAVALVVIASSARAAPPEIPEVVAELPGWSAGRPAAVIRKLEAIVRRAGADPALRAALARALDGILLGEAQPDAKDAALRALAAIGDAESIDPVGTRLDDPRLGHLAAATLAVLPDGAGTRATGLLVAALADASIADSVRVAAADALRRRGDDAALNALAETARTGVGATGSAAIAALGASTRPEAAAALASIPLERLDTTSRRTMLDALLMAADARISADDAPRAKSLLDRAAMLSELDADRLAIARLRLLTLDDDVPRMVTFLTDRRADWRGTALEAVRSGAGRDLAALAVAALPKLPADAQADLVAALGARGDLGARDATVTAAGSDDARVRVAAIGALRTLGDARDVGLLIDGLAGPSQAIADAAAATLVAMRGADIDAAIGDRIVAADGAPGDAGQHPVVRRLLDVLAQRPGRAPLDAIGRALRQSQATRLAAIEAMGAHPAPHFVTALGGIASGRHAPELRAPAFAAWIACLGAPGAKPPEWAAAALPGAMAAATNDDERAAVAALAARFPERASIEFLSPLVARGGPQPAAVRRAARDSTLAIARALPRDQRRDALAAIRSALDGETADDPAFRAAAAGAANAVESNLDFVRSWQVAGPFAKEGMDLAGLFDTTFAPEAEPDGAGVFWRELAGAAIEPSGVVNLAKFVGAGDDRVAYLRTRLFSPHAQRVRLELGSDDGVKAWLNETPVHAKNTPRGLRAGEDVVEVDLREGWNTLVLKVTQGSGDWAACCRVRSPEGLPAEGVHAFADPRRAAPLPGATVLLGDSGLGAWRRRDGADVRWTFADGVATVVPGAGDILTRDAFGDCTLHVEFLCPDNPPEVTGQQRSNSGIFLQDRYEVQVLDSFGDGVAKDRVGAIYGRHVPAHDVARRPGQWQDVLIDFTAPRWDRSDPAAPKKAANARMTVWLNGVRIHDDVEIDGVTTTGVAEQPGDAPIRLQDHGNPVRFRNVWVVPRSGWEGPKAPGFVPLFDGTSLAGWTRRGGKASFTVADGAIVGATRPNEHNSFLCSGEFGDFVLELEFKADDAANSGIQLRSAARPEDGGERVVGYQCEIDPSSRGWTAGVYDEARRGWLAPPATPRAKAAYRSGEWNRLRIEARGPEIRTWLNEVPVSLLWDSLSPRGFFGLQVHGVGDRVEPLEVRWRDVRIRNVGG